MGPQWTVDVGGTITDGFFRCGSEAVAVKVDTTRHDPMVCPFDCLTEGALRLGSPTPNP